MTNPNLLTNKYMGQTVESELTDKGWVHRWNGREYKTLIDVLERIKRPKPTPKAPPDETNKPGD